MKTVSELIQSLEVLSLRGDANAEVKGICFDSREAVQGYMFVAQQGEQADGHRFVPQAVAQGACCVVVERMPESCPENVCVVQVADSHLALAQLAAAFYNHPSRELKLVGITGTNGKTTTVTLLYRLFTALGHKVGLLSTIENRIGEEVLPAHHTTPDALELQRLLRQMADAGCSHCFMEVSSHSIVQQRVAALHFAGGIFSNITHDHLDYHKTFAAYLKAKTAFFDNLPATAFALTNADDANGRVMLQNTAAHPYTYSLKSSNADFKVRVVECQLQGMQLELDRKEVWTRLTGEFNAYNLVAIYATACLLGEDKERLLVQLSALEAAEGRFFCIHGDRQVTAIVDYAHTPDALDNVLRTIQKIRRAGQRILTVVGCGGNRDKSKRPEMAQISFQRSDFLILTSDNPRFEQPSDILEDMRKGLEGEDEASYLVIPDRREAIKCALRMAAPGDIVLVAGKGHEKYQEIKGVKYPFDDVAVVRQYLCSETNEK
ncbi:MAG: UDP-N-acetylmuramoyl-L-alanyl-D-glutamate--2,6-diaminopimelate ligase [Bacteroidales bacterium]|nr:UDP-N-acetylmuramoyl-L-alanyl-D-glutamate--2,6-diaminopimelate ligase [Bacteroidales bacterium]